MPSVLMMVFVGFDLVFAGCGGLLMGFSLMAEQNLRAAPTPDNVAQNLLLGQCPLTGTTTPDRTQEEGWRSRLESILPHYCGGPPSHPTAGSLIRARH